MPFCRFGLPGALVLAVSGEVVEVTNAGFESTGGWENLDSSVGQSVPSIKCMLLSEAPERCPDEGREDFQRCNFAQRDAPPEGSGFAVLTGGGDRMTQATGVKIEEGVTYSLRVWARGINPSWGGISSATEVVDVTTKVAAALTGGGATLASVEVDVGAPKMQGDARSDLDCEVCAQDDGANVWLADGYRFHIGQGILYQEQSQDPILDPWVRADGGDFDGMAKAPIITPQGLQAVSGTWYRDASPVWSKISMHPFSGASPNGLVFEGFDEDGGPLESSIILSNMKNNELPWVIDSHLFYDADAGRLWMTWGGHETWLSELDPASGHVCCSDRCTSEQGRCASVDYNTHAAGVHTKILSWDDLANPDNADFQGDGCGQRYMEGPALYKHDGYFFAFSSWGSMGEDYTIRVCRSKDVRGPYLDKEGNDCATFKGDVGTGTYGSSMLLGPEGEQSVPGHAHVWEEAGTFYLGYDFRKGAATKASGEEGTDFMAIRKLQWISDEAIGVWPTIWQPLDVTMTGTSANAGQTLGISLWSPSAGAMAGVDLVSLTSAPGPEASGATWNGCETSSSSLYCVFLVWVQVYYACSARLYTL